MELGYIALTFLAVLGALVLVHKSQSDRTSRLLRMSESPTPSLSEPPKNYRVFTLGASGAGKTCFMASLYNRLKSTSVDTGFYLKVSPQQHAKLTGLYNEITNPSEGWPPGTVTEREWQFCTFVPATQGNVSFRAFDFTYLDYAGGHLKDSQQANALDAHRRIAEADTVLVLLDGHKILRRLLRAEHETVNPNERLGADLNFLIPYLNDAHSKPVHVVVSKWDILEGSFTLAQVRDCLMQYREFANFIAWRAHRGTPTRLIPVSAVGSGFASLGADGMMTKDPQIVPNPLHIEISMAATMSDLFEAAAVQLGAQQVELLHRVAWGQPEPQASKWLWTGASNLLSHLPYPASMLTVVAPVLRDLLAARRKTPAELSREFFKSLQEVRNKETAIQTVLASHRRSMRLFELQYPESVLVPGLAAPLQFAG